MNLQIIMLPDAFTPGPSTAREAPLLQPSENLLSQSWVAPTHQWAGNLLHFLVWGQVDNH